MSSRTRNLGAHAISALGMAIMLIALYLHWRYDQELELMVLLLGAFFVWLGGFWADSKRSIEGGTFIVDSIVKLGSVVRIGGRRATDAPVVQAAPPAAAPLVSSEPSDAPPNTWNHGRDEGVL